MPIRLGDDIDDFCIKCKRLTNHSVVSLVGDQAAKVRCRTCYHDHDFRNGEPLPSKKELKKAALLEEALKNGGTPPGDNEEPDLEVVESVDGGEGSAVDGAPAKSAKKGAAKKASTAKKG
jgi:hypothetical protein